MSIEEQKKPWDGYVDNEEDESEIAQEDTRDKETDSSKADHNKQEIIESEVPISRWQKGLQT